MTKLASCFAELSQQTRLKFWSWVCFFMGLLFAISTYLQHNDPDAYLWIIFYAVPSLLSFYLFWRGLFCRSEVYSVSPLVTQLSGFHIFYGLLLFCYTLIHLLWLEGNEIKETSSLFSQMSEKMIFEEAKELLGLCTVNLHLFVILYISQRSLISTVAVKLAVGDILFPFVSWYLLYYQLPVNKGCV